MMAILDGEGRYLVVGVVLGATAARLSRGLPTSLVDVGRPLAKAGVRLGMAGAERALELYGRLTETVEDLTAEVLAERAAEVSAPVAEETASLPEVVTPVEPAATESERAARRPARRRRTKP
jgi:hypothetical protein